MVVSTNTEAKYFPEGVMLMVTVFTIPLNLRCSTAENIFGFRYGECPFFKIHMAMLGAKKTLPVPAALETWFILCYFRAIRFVNHNFRF